MTVKDHPFLGSGQFTEHRVVMTDFLNRKLLPNENIHHINGDGKDNRIENLRECTHKQNQWNRKISKNNSSGIKGISWDKHNKKWFTSCVDSSGKTFRKGFCSIQEAENAVRLFRESEHGQFTNHG